MRSGRGALGERVTLAHELLHNFRALQDPVGHDTRYTTALQVPAAPARANPVSREWASCSAAATGWAQKLSRAHLCITFTARVKCPRMSWYRQAGRQAVLALLQHLSTLQGLDVW